jgi:hypothetical protein
MWKITYNRRMIEPFILIALCVSLGKMMREKGRPAIGVQLLLVAFWVLGELTAGFLAVVAHRHWFGEQALWPPSLYLIPIVGAFSGALLAYLFAFSLPDYLPRTIAERTRSHS